jgi:hypothetical protein
MKKSLIFFGILLTFSCFAFSQSISNVHVLSEEDSASNKNCGISSESSTAAVKSALRYNRIPFADSALNRDFTLYINVNNFKVDSQHCSVNAALKIYFFSRVPVPKTGKSLFLPSELCSRATSGFLPIREMQNSINAALKSFVDECVLSIEEELRKQG